MLAFFRSLHSLGSSSTGTCSISSTIGFSPTASSTSTSRVECVAPPDASSDRLDPLFDDDSGSGGDVEGYARPSELFVVPLSVGPISFEFVSRAADMARCVMSCGGIVVAILQFSGIYAFDCSSRGLYYNVDPSVKRSRRKEDYEGIYGGMARLRIRRFVISPRLCEI
jgi:hypothetical protein